jgi:hypothetical protein
MLQQHEKNPDGLLTQFDLDAVLAKFASSGIEFKWLKAQKASF